MTQTEKKISSKFIYFFGSFGGILFGYDIGVMTGALPFLQQDWALQNGLYTFYCVMILLHYTAFLIYHKIKSILVYTKRAIMASFSCVSYHENSIRKYGVHYDLFKLYYKYY